MDAQDHKTAATSTGHEDHGVHLCHRCGWPFPNPHPSAKHRRAHKRVCGTIEGYEIEHDHHLAVSEDERDSDENEHTPSLNLVKKNAQGSGRVGEKSNKSEDDVFSDAVTDFSDSGISPRLEERFESMREEDKIMEQKGVQVKVGQTADRTEESNDPRKSEEMTSTEPGVNGTNLLGSMISATDTSAKADSGHDQMKSGPDAALQNHLPSVTLDSEEGEILDQSRALPAAKKLEESCYKSPSELVKHDLPSQTEALEDLLGTSEAVDCGGNLAKRSTSNKTVNVALVDEIHKNLSASVGVKEIPPSTEETRPSGNIVENISPQEDAAEHSTDASVGVKEVPQSTEEIMPVGNIVENISPQELATECPDVALVDSSFDQEVKPKTSLAGVENADCFDASEGQNCDMNGIEKQNLESKDSFSVDTVLAPGSADKTFASKNNETTREFKKDVPRHEDKETEIEKGSGNSMEKQVILDPTIPSDEATDSPNSCAVDSDARNLGELLKKESISLESRDDDFEKSIPGVGMVGTGEMDSKRNRDIGDVLDKDSSPIASFGVMDHIHVTENVVRVEPVDVKSVSKLKDDCGVLASEKTAEQSKESMSLSTDSELPNENPANESSCTKESIKASESIETTNVTDKPDNEDAVVSPREMSENPTSKCLDVTSPGDEEKHSSEDFSKLKSVGIFSSPDHDGNVLATDKCSVNQTVKEPVPSPSDLHETSVTVDYKTVINVENVSCPDSKSLRAEVDDKLAKENDGISEVNLSGSLSIRADSLEANCGSIVSDTLETNSDKYKATAEGAKPDKSDTFEPRSFMTLVQSGCEETRVKAAAEIENVQNDQQPKADDLQAGWSPSLINVVNDSEGRKKNEEVIAKVTSSSPVKQQHGNLKSLLNEVKSPDTKQVEMETKDNGAAVSVRPAAKDQGTNKDVEEWNSPARYPIEIRKEKKKGRSYWVPFVCCSSVHRDL